MYRIFIGKLMHLKEDNYKWSRLMDINNIYMAKIYIQAKGLPYQILRWFIVRLF